MLYRKPTAAYLCLNASPDYILGIEIGMAILIANNVLQVGCGGHLFSDFRINFQYGFVF
jgi:hypothetical protein